MINQPNRRNLSHPGPNQRNPLSCKEETVIARSKGGEGEGERHEGQRMERRDKEREETKKRDEDEKGKPSTSENYRQIKEMNSALHHSSLPTTTACN